MIAKLIFLILSILLYVLAGLLFASNAIMSAKRFESEEEKQNIEIICEKNSKHIGILLLVGAFLGISGALAVELSWKIGVGILIAAFIVGVIIRIRIQKNQP